MRIRFREAPIAEWVIATTRGQDPADLPPFQIYGYGVDVGMGSFADSAGLASILRQFEGQRENPVRRVLFRARSTRLPSRRRPQRGHPARPRERRDLIVCSSGQGDGFYASYWGLSAEGRPVWLVTDFGLLSHHVHATRELGPLADLLGRRVRLELPGGGAQLLMRMPDKFTLVVKASGEGVATAEFELRQGSASVRQSGATVSYGESGRTIETRFEEPIPDRAVVVVTHLDRIEPL